MVPRRERHTVKRSGGTEAATFHADASSADRCDALRHPSHTPGGGEFVAVTGETGWSLVLRRTARFFGRRGLFRSVQATEIRIRLQRAELLFGIVHGTASTRSGLHLIRRNLPPGNVYTAISRHVDPLVSEYTHDPISSAACTRAPVPPNRPREYASYREIRRRRHERTRLFRGSDAHSSATGTSTRRSPRKPRASRSRSRASPAAPGMAQATPGRCEAERGTRARTVRLRRSTHP
jgi:hypothetical protein